MSISFTNYSLKGLKESIKNFRFFEDNSSTQSNTFRVFLELSIDLDRLDLQARVFADNYAQHGYINFYKTFDLKNNTVTDELYKLYIYSFVKALYHGFFFQNLSQDSMVGNIFYGHRLLYSLLRNPNNHQLSGEDYIGYNINVGTMNNRKAVIASLLSRFKFLKEYTNYNNDSFGCGIFIIPSFETYLEKLAKGYYTKEFFSKGGGDADDDKKEKKSDDQIFQYGKLIMSDDDSDVRAYCTDFNKSPVMNSFYSNKQNRLFFSQVMNGKKMEFNHSLFISQALFLTLSKNNNNLTEITRYYNSILLTPKQIHTVGSEVSSVTGITPRFISSVPGTVSPFKNFPTIEQFENFVVNLEQIGKNLGDLLEYFESLKEDDDVFVKTNKFLENNGATTK